MRTSHLFGLVLGAVLAAGPALAAPVDPSPGDQPTQPRVGQPEKPGAGLTLPALPNPSDEQIAGVVKQINSLQVDLADPARTKAMSPQVKQFAELVRTDFKNSDKTLDEVDSRLKIKVADTDTSRAVKAMNEKEVARLKGMEGWNYDRAFIDQQISYNTLLVDYIDNALLPKVRSPEMKELLVSERALVSSHLDAAKQIQSTLQAMPQGGTR